MEETNVFLRKVSESADLRVAHRGTEGVGCCIWFADILVWIRDSSKWIWISILTWFTILICIDPKQYGSFWCERIIRKIAPNAAKRVVIPKQTSQPNGVVWRKIKGKPCLFLNCYLPHNFSSFINFWRSTDSQVDQAWNSNVTFSCEEQPFWITLIQTWCPWVLRTRGAATYKGPHPHVPTLAMLQANQHVAG